MTILAPRDEPPPWFRDAEQPRQAFADVEGIHISYVEWGRPEQPTLLLVHGMSAHARWWDFVAALLADSHHLVAFDLSGHGDSSHRPRYTRTGWVAEVTAIVAAAAGPGPIMVGHSLGGSIAAAAVAADPSVAAGLIVIDSKIHSSTSAERSAFGGRRTYLSQAEAAARFRLIPPQPPLPRWVHEHVVEHAVVRVQDGWTWKFDPRAVEDYAMDDAPLADSLRAARCPIAVIGFEHSAVFPATDRSALEREVGLPVTVIPDAHHHAILDHPVEVAGAIRSLIAPATETHRGPVTIRPPGLAPPR